MEALISRDPKKTKERLITLLLLFLVILIPLSLLNKNDTGGVDITGLYTESISDDAVEVFFNIDNHLNLDLMCKVSVSYFKNGILYASEVKDFGKVLKLESRIGSTTIEMPGGETTFRIRPECFPIE